MENRYRHIAENDKTNHSKTLIAATCFLFLLLTGIFCTVSAAEPQQNSAIAWTKTYPDCDLCEAHAITRTVDGGYLITGTSESNPNRHDLLILKTDSKGNEQWKTSSSANSCEGNAVITMANGNAAVLGGGCNIAPDAATLTVIENTKGAVQKIWNFEAGGHATGTALLSTGDNGYLLLSEGDTKTAGRNDRDVGIIRVDSNGAILWTKIFSGSLNDTSKAVVMAPDGGFVIAGSTRNSVSNREEILLLKLDGKGTEQWVKTIGTENDETAQSIATTGDGGYVIAGTSCQLGRTGNCDIHIVSTDAAGITRWDRKYGGTGRDSAAVILASPDGGFIIAGSSDSPERGAQGRDVHIIHIDDKGNELWTSTFGTPSYEIITGAIIATDGSLVVTGYTTDPVETNRRTLFITSISRAGRDPPAELLRSASQPPKDAGIEIRVRDRKTGAGVADAQVYYDGKIAGKTSETEGIYLIAKASTGSHSVRITKSGYQETTVKTDSNTGSSLTVHLQPSVIQKIYGDASPETALDIVFVPSKTSYDCGLQTKIPAEPYINHPETFLDEAKRLSEQKLFQLGSYSSVPVKISNDYQKRLNIYYYWDGERYADAFEGCAGTLPDGFWDEAPYADVAIIIYPKYYGVNKGGICEPIGCTNGIGPGTSTWFKAPANNGPVFLHEAGHAIFGLMDTYCGNTYYSENTPFPNIWQSENNCISDTVKTGVSGSECRQIGNVVGSKSTCGKDYWRYDRDVDLMAATSTSATFGESSTRRIQYIFDAVGRIR